MAKRKLTEQQQRRIAVRPDLTHAIEGLLIANYGMEADVEIHPQTLVRCALRKNLPPMVTGDRVFLEKTGENQYVILALGDRKTVLSRPDAHHKTKLLAANVTQIAIMQAVIPAPSHLLLDSYLVAAEMVGVSPLIILNKTDLLVDADKPDFERFFAIYEAIGYPVLQVSIKQPETIEKLYQHLKGETSVFVGQSGVGKSKWIQEFTQNKAILIGELAKTTGFGLHTTSTTVLYHLQDGGDVIDSPGVREFGLWNLDPEKIARSFIEFRDFLGHCQYRNCLHHHESGCAILHAVENGNISPKRLMSYRKLTGCLS